MGCDTCTNGTGEIHPGCKNNGACGNMLDVHDWLANVFYEDEEDVTQRVEVRFKATRKEIFKNPKQIRLEIGDPVVVESDTGYDVGHVSMKGELVKLQMKKKSIKEDDELLSVLRKAGENDLETYRQAKERELPTMFETRRLAKEHGLVMKVSDVEYQGDNKKATFYYTADGRVDYRDLIKVLGRTFKVKVEMKQIGLRQEAGRIGGIGDCGRELCCSTWLTEFNSVPTVAAKYQNLFLNPLKLSGQCGRLKCCLNYELDTYLEALEEFPDENTVLETQKGQAKVAKVDILKRMMWFQYQQPQGEEDHVVPTQFYPLALDTVHEIIAMNKKGEKPMDLEDFAYQEEATAEVEEKQEFKDAVGQESVTRFDKGGKKQKSGKKQGSKKGNQDNRNKSDKGKRNKKGNKNNPNQQNPQSN